MSLLWQEINIVGRAREVKGHLFEILVQPRALYKKGTYKGHMSLSANLALGKN